MVGSVNIVAAPEPVHQRAAQARKQAANPAHPDEMASRPARNAYEGSSLATPERLGYAKLAQLSRVLTTLASARTSGRDRAAGALQQVEQKLRRLKAEALTAAASGDRKAAAQIARELGEVAREIADAAQDYAAAGGEAVLMAASLADAGIAIGAPPGQDAAESETPKAGADDRNAASFAEIIQEVTEKVARTVADPAGAAESDAGAADSTTPQAAANAPSPHPAAPDDTDQTYRNALPRPGSGSHADDTFEENARKMLEDVTSLIRSMERVQRDPSAQAEAPGPTIGTGLSLLVVRPPVQRQPRG